MAPSAPKGSVPVSLGDLLTLARTRRLVFRPVYRIVAASIALVYAFVSMIIGGMLQLSIPPVASPSFWLVIPSGDPWWNYPGLLVVNPAFVLELPFLPTVSMIVVSIGVGLGMTVAVVLTGSLIRRRKAELGRPATVSSVAGLTPLMIALVTLGACCSTTAAATAGVGVAAQVSGTSVNALLLNNWYLGLFQVGILYVALLAQEQLLAVYGFLFQTSSSVELDPPRATPTAPLSRGIVAGAALRVGLLAGGVTWSLAMFAEWTAIPPESASAGVWFSWLAQHQLLAVTAMVAALAPLILSSYLRRNSRSLTGLVFRGALLVVGLSLAGWDPPVVVGWGVHGFVNELFGVWGLPASIGAVAPSEPLGLGLILRWGFQYLLLGGFAVWMAWSTERAIAPMLATVGSYPPGTPDQVPKATLASGGTVLSASSGATEPRDSSRSPSFPSTDVREVN